MNMRKRNILLISGAIQILAFLMILFTNDTDNLIDEENIPTTYVAKRSYPIEIHSVGELEAARSISLASQLRSDQPKIIELIADGLNVQTGDLLVKVDPTSFENKLEELKGAIKECECQVCSCEQTLAWEAEQSALEDRAAEFERETAELELSKIILGDGPLEIAKLKGALLKAKAKFDELNNYSEDLIALEKEGFLEPAEVRQTQKKLQEERETYEAAKLQHDSYVNHVNPMQIKKAESSLKKLLNKLEETSRASHFKQLKAEAALTQAKQQLEDKKRQLRDAQWELGLTEIRAPSPGMVVLKEEYRSGQRRKPRVGDLLVRNQTILDLPDMSSMMVKTKVREIDLYKVEIGKKATIEVDAYPNLRFEGKVSFIGILAMADMVLGDEKYFEVKVALDSTDQRLRPGMTSRVVIHANKVENALTVPVHAVFERDKKLYAYVVRKGRYVMQPVEIGLNNEQWAEVRSGLKENERVALAMPPESAQHKDAAQTQFNAKAQKRKGTQRYGK